MIYTITNVLVCPVHYDIIIFHGDHTNHHDPHPKIASQLLRPSGYVHGQWPWRPQLSEKILLNFGWAPTNRWLSYNWIPLLKSFPFCFIPCDPRPWRYPGPAGHFCPSHLLTQPYLLLKTAPTTQYSLLLAHSYG